MASKPRPLKEPPDVAGCVQIDIPYCVG